MKQLGQFPLPSHTIAHLSDTHLLDDDLLYGRLDGAATLRDSLQRLAQLEVPPQAIVLTGDLADVAEPGAYRQVRELVEASAADLGAQIVWVMGNHDARAPYARELFGEEATDDDVQDRVYDVDGLRIVSIDTAVPGFHHGELRDAQLEWLADVLATPAPHGTLLAMHHPPIPSPLVRAAAIIELHDVPRLEEVVRGTDVRLVMGGHYHCPSYSTFAGGIPVSVASSTCYLADPAPAGRLLSAVAGHQSLTMVHVYDDRVVNTVVSVPEAEEVDGYAYELIDQVEALTPDEQLRLLSAKDSPLWVHEHPID